jgi:hypothetical protein
LLTSPCETFKMIDESGCSEVRLAHNYNLNISQNIVLLGKTELEIIWVILYNNIFKTKLSYGPDKASLLYKNWNKIIFGQHIQLAALMSWFYFPPSKLFMNNLLVPWASLMWLESIFKRIHIGWWRLLFGKILKYCINKVCSNGCIIFNMDLVDLLQGRYK